MNRASLIVRNLRFHFRGNLAVLLGTLVGSAVLTGALLVGDSLRGSLRERTDRQLGGIDNVLIGGRFVRASLASELPGTVRGVLFLRGAVYAGSPDGDQRAGNVAVWGVDRRFGIDRAELDGKEPIAILSANLANKLQVKDNDTIYLSIQKASGMPRASLLARRGIADTTSKIKLTVKTILIDSDPANALSLSISPTLPLNIFVPLVLLQQQIEQPGRINALLGSGQSAQSLQSELRNRIDLSDWGLTVEVAPFRKTYINVTSKQLLLAPAVVEAIQKTAQEMGLDSAKTYAYLANEIRYGNKTIPYSIVAALEPTKKAPLGPFLPAGVDSLNADEIVLVDWKDSPIKIDPQDKDPQITIQYYKPEIEGQIEKASHSFHYRGTIPLDGVANDRNLTPEFPGITDRESITESGNLKGWDPPFEIDTNKIDKKRDEQFWKDYRTTPKAYIGLDDGKKLWGTRFGDVTSIRVAPRAGADLDKTLDEFKRRLLANLDPAASGLTVQPIRQRMLTASQGSTDFGMLFLSFSFFLIVAALMLVGLLFRLSLDRRASEIGLLRASGFPLRTVRWLLLSEGMVLATVGSLLGLVGAIAYADAMVKLLVALWPTPGVESYLKLHVTSLSLGIGVFSSVLMSGLAILWALRSLNKSSPVQLLKGDTTPAAAGAKRYRPSPWPKRIVMVSFVCAAFLAIAGPFMPPGEPQAGTFFGSGALLLTALLTLLWAWMKRPRHALVSGHGVAALAKLGSRNAVRNPVRSLLTAGLLAAAAFLLVAVESFRRVPDRDFLQLKGGSGGFPLLAEAATPIDFDPNDNEGRGEIREALELELQKDPKITGVERKERAERDMAALADVKFHRFRVQGGDDASCLNLYQASQPRLLGVPHSIIERGGFSFGATVSHSDNRWLQLNGPNGPGEDIPCIVEQNTAMWMLKKGLGDTFEMRDEENRPFKLKIVALLKDSVFQSQVLISDDAFRRHFPKTEGFGFFLLDVPPDKEKEVSRVLTNALANYGFEVTPTKERVAQYLAVQNTYLTTFQLLGGFGLLLGVLGLAVVLLRNVWERRAEMALMRALGYRKRSLNGIVLAENALLLMAGLGAGIFAALAAVAPHLASGGQVPWARLGLMLGLVFVVGISVAYIAVLSTLRAPLIPALREE